MWCHVPLGDISAGAASSFGPASCVHSVFLLFQHISLKRKQYWQVGMQVRSAYIIEKKAILASGYAGAIQPMEEIGALCRERKIFFHTDAAQAVGKVCYTCICRMGLGVSGYGMFGV